MLSRITLIIFAVNFISFGRGDKFKPVIKCAKAAGESAKAILEAENGGHETFEDKIRLTCLAFKEFSSCLVAIIKSKSSSVPKMLNFYAAMEYQHYYLAKKAGLCPNIKYDELKKITMESGIMKEEKLANIENDDYAKCAGDALRKCMFGVGVSMLEHHVRIVGQDYAYLTCMEEEAKSCTAPMMQHLMSLLEASFKHMKEMLEEV